MKTEQRDQRTRRIGVKNTSYGYGWVAIILHWLVATTVIGMFALGWWMTDLSYYDDWYKRGPFIHKSVGILLFAVMVFRVVWRLINENPKDEPNVGVVQRWAAHVTHYSLYGLLFVLMVSGYFISTADGRAIEVFGWFSVPATVTDVEHMEDIAGVVHWYVALTVMAMASIHALAALKHHWIDKDRTLKKMLGISPSDSQR